MCSAVASKASTWSPRLPLGSPTAGVRAAPCASDVSDSARARRSPFSILAQPPWPPKRPRLRSKTASRVLQVAGDASVSSTVSSKSTRFSVMAPANASMPSSPILLEPRSTEKSARCPTSALASLCAAKSVRPQPRRERRCRPGCSSIAAHHASHALGLPARSLPSKVNDRVARRPRRNAEATASDASENRPKHDRSTNFALQASRR
mmetsp:Transcript_71932/g.233817  ORF Transcript_71932/g.233817 Transcript_71932/m.233817 type:complete len:207 (-) Transcript_71932:425-1045(-)